MRPPSALRKRSLHPRLNLEALAAVWAAHAPVACIDPGWAPLQGRESVIASWKSIMEGQPPRIVCFGARAYVFGDSGFVICSERLEGRHPTDQIDLPF